MSSLLVQILDEGPLTATRAAKLPIIVATREGPPSAATVSRWHRKGVVLPDGSRLKLEAVHLNGKVVTSEARILAFFERQQPSAPSRPIAPSRPLRSPAQQRAASEAAMAELEAAGC